MKKIISLVFITLISMMLFQSCSCRDEYKKGQVWVHYDNGNPFDSSLYYIIDIKRGTNRDYIHFEDITHGFDTTVTYHNFWVKTEYKYSDSLTIEKPYKKSINDLREVEDNNINLNNLDLNEYPDLVQIVEEYNINLNNLDLNEYPDLVQIVEKYKNNTGNDEVNYSDLLIWINKNYYLTKK